ncbi:ribosome biogenesis GTPase YlqF [Candidatus Mycoplasma pogonae]
MAKAMKQIKEKQSLADLFIIVLDARAPISTYNAEFDDIVPSKPRLFVITKVDLADANKLNAITQRFNSVNSKTILVNLKKNVSKAKLLKMIQQMLEEKKQRDLKKGLLKPRLRIFVMGVPNSGKSTLINLLANSKTKVGNMPGITRSQQWINCGEFQLLDTPGILWPKFDDQLVAIKLAIIGSISFDAIANKEFFDESYRLLSKYYPEKLTLLGLEPANNEVAIYNNLYKLCSLKNMFLNNHQPDTKKAIEWFRNYVKDLKNVTYD